MVVSERIDIAINSLLVGSQGEINSRIEQISFDVKIGGTETRVHSYCLKADGNGNIRLNDLIDYIDTRIVDYAIPKKELDGAKQYFDATGSTKEIIKLRKKAKGLFTELEKTGEGGEILLYILILEFLKIPQLISKMSLKTSGALHYQGADGIHVKYDQEKEELNLYWGEAKMYQDFTSAIRECISGLKGYILDPFSANSIQERDISLITSNISNNVNDEELEELLVSYFDLDNPLSNKVVYKGIGFIGFDYNKYPVSGTTSCTTDAIKIAIQGELSSWNSKIQRKIKEHTNLEIKEIHLFLMPFPSVKDFRTRYLSEIE